MSIIHDALKKTEGAITASPTPPPIIPVPDPSEEVKQAMRDKHRKQKLKKIPHYVLAVLLGLYVSNQFFGFLTPSKYIPVAFTKPLLAKKTPSPPAPSWPPQPAVNEKPGLLENIPLLPAPKKETKTLTLNGIFFSKEQGYALINNRVVKTGDTIGNAKVVKIKPEEVELEQDGNPLKLTTR
jgi:hypothetical protein